MKPDNKSDKNYQLPEEVTLNPKHSMEIYNDGVTRQVWNVLSGSAVSSDSIGKSIVYHKDDKIIIKSRSRLTFYNGNEDNFIVSRLTRNRYAGHNIDENTANSLRFRDKFGFDGNNLSGEGNKKPLGSDSMPYDHLDDIEFVEDTLRRAESSPAVIPDLIMGLEALVAKFRQAAFPSEELSDVTGTVEIISHEDIWRSVNAAKSREHRANLTSEQMAIQSKQASKRVAAYRQRMTPEQRQARSAKEAERLRRKRASAKDPQP